MGGARLFDRGSSGDLTEGVAKWEFTNPLLAHGRSDLSEAAVGTPVLPKGVSRCKSFSFKLVNVSCCFPVVISVAAAAGVGMVELCSGFMTIESP